ncbi:NACHT domain-containing protein [Streptomyces sp. NPDC054841]
MGTRQGERGGRDEGDQQGEWGARDARDSRNNWRPPTEVRNIVRDSTVEYLIQTGHVWGDLVVNLPAPAAPVDTAAEELARAVHAQWSAEVAAWELGDMESPLSVRFLARWAAGPRSGDPAGADGGDGRDAGDEARAVRSDRADAVVDRLQDLPVRRLVVLGGPGSGKSTLLAMTALLLAGRHLGDVTRAAAGDRTVPVPVLLSLESWDAENVAFADWLITRITTDHPGLPRLDGVHPARRLVRDGRILAVLDGLDELPEHRRVAVVRELNAAPRRLGCVLASRTEQYRALEQRLEGASDIEALPVRQRAAAVHLLRTAPPERHAQWGPVVDELADHPEGPLGQALSTPLMIWLARRAYRRRHTDPAHLTDRAALPTREAVEKHLMDAVIPAAFEPRASDSERLHAPGGWNPARARGWLAFLARELQRRRTSEFAWWHLNRATAARLLAVPTLLALGIAATESVLAASAWVQDHHGDPVYFRIDLFERNYVFGGFVFGSGIRVAQLYWFGDRFGEPRRRANPFRSGAALRSASRPVSVRRGLTAAAVLLVPSLLLLWSALSTHDPDAFTAQAVLGFVLPTLLMVVIAAPSDTTDAATPDTLLTSERRTALLTLALVAPLIGLGTGAHRLLTGHGAVDAGVAFAKGFTGAALVLALLSPWSLWVVSKAWLAVLGRVPWSLMEFLRDAHGAGLLQRHGGTYRFRHLRLQEHLAPRPEPRAAVAAPGQQPLTVTGPQPRRPVPGPAVSEPLPRFSEILDAMPPMHSLPGWTVVSNDREYVLSGRERRLPLGHWVPCGVFAVVALMRTAVTGNWDTWIGWTSVLLWPCLALSINIVAFLLPKVRMTLRIDPYGVTAGLGRRSASYAWRDVVAVSVRQVVIRGRNQRTYGPHVRLRPGAPEPPAVFRGRGGWYLVMPLHIRPAMPPDIVDALRRFSGGRWQE